MSRDRQLMGKTQNENIIFKKLNNTLQVPTIEEAL